MRRLVVTTILLSLAPAFSVRAALHTGIGVLVPAAQPAGWDFSTEASAPPGQADLIIIFVVDPPPQRDVVTSINGTVFTIVSLPYEDVTEAPADLNLYVSELPAQYSTTYVAFTPEGHFAKFRILDIGFPTIEYAYQDDGSRTLTPNLPVGDSSWGRIKAVFQTDRH